LKFAALTLLISTVALADEPKVAVQTEIVHAQEKAGTIDPGLQEMQAKLAEGKKYGTLKRLSTQKLTLQTLPATVPLPNGKQAELSVVTLVEGVATIKIKVPGLGESTSKLGRDRSLYQGAGKLEGGDLWLVLSQPK
jgi:hypothetical protein